MGVRKGTYSNGFAPRDFAPRYPGLWKQCVGAWNPALGPTGPTLRDWSAFKGHGTLTNFTLSTAWTVGLGVYQLTHANASSQFVSIADSAALTLTDFTISLWFQAATLPSEPTFYQKGDLGAGKTAAFGLTHFVTDSFFYFYHGASAAASSATWTRDTARHHLAVTKSGSAGTLFLDGKQHSTFTGIANVTNASALQIGGGNKGYFDGGMTDYMLWNRVLNPNEIRTLSTRPGAAYEYERTPNLMTNLKAGGAGIFTGGTLRSRIIQARGAV